MKSAKTTVVFLDIDGVLVHGGYNPSNNKGFIVDFDPACAAALNYLYNAIPFDIVISSCWGNFHSLEYLQTTLADVGVKASVIDITPRTFSSTRGQEIKHWLDDHPNKRFIIIDDEIYDITPFFSNDSIIHTKDGWDKGGLKESHVDNFLRKKGVE